MQASPRLVAALIFILPALVAGQAPEPTITGNAAAAASQSEATPAPASETPPVLPAESAETPPPREQTPATPQPQNLDALERGFVLEVQAAHESFDQRLREIREKRLRQLRGLMDDAMAKKDAAETLRIGAAIADAERELDILPLDLGHNDPRAVVSVPKLRRHLAGTTWRWAGESLHFHPDGKVRQPTWEAHGLVTGWEPVDRRTVVLRILKGRDSDRYAILKFNDDLTHFEAMDFEGRQLLRNERLQR